MSGRNRNMSAKDGSESEMEDLEKLLKKLDVGEEKRDVNILLLGETGVGKSTFINSFCNYLRCSDLKQAMATKDQLITLIPTSFTIMDNNFEERLIKVGPADANEYLETGASATQTCRSYVFPIRKGKLRIRLIDTPGIGDVRGINQDNENFENVLSFISEFKHLNAICILLKPNNARLTVMFEFCIKQLLSRLEKSASNNIVFVFTNSRSTFYRPGDTMPVLKKMLSELKNVKIPTDRENVFCTDNEAFRFLAANNNGIKFEKMDVENFATSWKKSVHECWRMIQYISGDNTRSPLVPHLVKNTISVNEARRIVVQLSQPLAEIAQLIQDNITILERHKRSIQLSDNTLADLKQKLYIPVVDLKVIEMDQPTTVCTSLKCSTVYQIGSKQKWHYHQRCHRPCYLTRVPKEIVGTPELAHCASMNSTGICQKCSCRYQVHMHIYYETETYEDRIEDEIIKSEIFDKTVALTKARNVITKIEQRLREYTNEREFIIKTTAKFAHFLQANAIAAYNDAYEGYLRYLIDREKSLGVNADYDVIKEFEQMLQYYNEEKNALNNALRNSAGRVSSITADDVIQCVESLYSLHHNGQKIRELFMKQKAARKDENKSEAREYVYSSSHKKQRKRNRHQTSNRNNTDSEHTTDNDSYRARHGNRGRPGRRQYGPRPSSYHQTQANSTPLHISINNDQFAFRYGQRSKTPEPISSPHYSYPRNQNYGSPHPNQNYGFPHPNQNYGQQGAYPKNTNAHFNLQCRVQNQPVPSIGPSHIPSLLHYQQPYRNPNTNYQKNQPLPTQLNNFKPKPNLYNMKTKTFNQTSSLSNNENKNTYRNDASFPKDFKYSKKNQRPNFTKHSDSESGRDTRRHYSYRNYSNAKVHNLDVPSSDSSSTDCSSDEETYHTCHK